MRKRFSILPLGIIFLCLAACSENEGGRLSNGYFSAEAQDFDSKGWKDFITIYVYNNKIVTVEYNSKNASGLVKTWDIEYQRQLQKKNGRLLKYYIRSYVSDLLDKQVPAGIRARGETRYYTAFTTLAEAAVGQSRAGDSRVARVPLVHPND